MITLYSRPGCKPCELLKAMFAQHGITYREIHPKDLDQAERDRVFAEILNVSRIATVSVPAARIDHHGHSHWVSSHGAEDITEMFDEIKKLLGH